MITLRNSDLVLKIAKETGGNIVKIAGLYLMTQTLSMKLKDITKDTSQLATQGLRSLRGRYEEKF